MKKIVKSTRAHEDVTSAVMYIPLEKGDEWVLWFKDGNYVTAEYTGKTRDNKLKFESVTYGDKYILDLSNNTCKNLEDGKEYELNNESGWVDTLRKAINEPITSSTDGTYQMCWWAKYLPAMNNNYQVYFEQDNTIQVEFEGTSEECQEYIAQITPEQEEEYGDEYLERLIRKCKGQPSMKYIYIPKSVTSDANEAHEIMMEAIPEPWTKCTFLGSIQKHRAEHEGATLLDTGITSAKSVLAATLMGGWEFDPIKESSHPDYSYWVTATKRNVGRFGAYIGGISLEDDSGAQLIDLTLSVSPIKPYDDADYHWAKFEGTMTRIIFKGKVVTKIPTDIREYDADTVEGCVKSLLCDIFDTLTEYNQDIKPRMMHN